MFIPMGSVVCICMFVLVLFTNRLPVVGLYTDVPKPIHRVIGVTGIAAGLWNVLWYALRHLGEYWGHMALGSGLLMIALGALLVMPASQRPRWSGKVRPVAVVALLAFALHYAYTIYHL